MQRFIRKVMRVFNARLALMITSMNIASLKFKKDLALKRDNSKASKKAAADKEKAAVQPEKDSAAQAADKGKRKGSLVTFDDSKSEKAFYDKTFSMWNLLDKFSRAKVCERVLQKMYRSHRIDVIEYNTKTLPKWEAWKTAQDIRDSVKFHMNDASSSKRKSWISSGTMVAPEFPRLRCQPKMSAASHRTRNQVFYQVAAACPGYSKIDRSHNIRCFARSNVQLSATTTNSRKGQQSLAAQKIVKMESSPGSRVVDADKIT